MSADTVLKHLAQLGITAWTADEKLMLVPGSKVPQELVQEVRKHKGEIIAVLNRSTELADLPFPIGYGGLPLAPVELAQALMDKWGVTDPILRKYNVLSWARGYYQDVGENDGEHYEALKREQARLGDMLDSQSKQYS